MGVKTRDYKSPRHGPKEALQKCREQAQMREAAERVARHIRSIGERRASTRQSRWAAQQLLQSFLRAEPGHTERPRREEVTQNADEERAGEVDENTAPRHLCDGDIAA